MILFDEATDRTLDKRYGHMDVRVVMTPFGSQIQDFINARTTFKYRVWSKLETLKSLREVERREEETRAHHAKWDEQEADDDPAPGKWTNEQAAIAIHALLRVAGLPEKHNKTTVAQFAHLLTGRSKNKMKKAGYEATGGTFSDNGAKAVIEQFEKLGLTKLADAVRNRDFTKL